MKKFFYLFISLLVVFLGLPPSVFAVQEINTPPIFVSPLASLNQDVVQLKNTVLNQERANRDQEIEDRSLAQQNAELTQRIADLQNQIAHPGQNTNTDDLYSRLENLRELKEALENYGRGLDERNRTLLDHQEGLNTLRARINKLEHLFDPVIDLTKEVEAMKSPSAAKLLSSLQDQKEFLVFKKQSLIEKYQQLLDFKAQLATTKEELENLQRQVKTSPWQGTNENLKYQKMSLEKYQRVLWEKDRHIADLEDQIIKKDEQIAQLKSNLALVHREISQMHQDLADLRQAYATDDEAFQRIRANIMALKQKLAAAQAPTAPPLAGSGQAQPGYSGGLTHEDEELIKLKGEIAVLNYRLENDQEDMRDYRNQTADLQKQLEEQKIKSAQLSSMLDVYQQKMDNKDAGFKEEVRQLQSDLEMAQKNLGQRENDLKKVKDYFFALEQRASAKNAELKDKSNRMAILDALVDKQSKDLRALQERLTVAEEKLKTSVDESELKNLKDSLREKDGQIDELTKEVENDKRTAKDLEVAKEKIASLMEDLYFKDKEVDRLKLLSAQKERASKEEMASLRAQLKKANEQLAHTTKLLKKCQSK